MGSLYGIETRPECREKIDKLLEMFDQAQQSMDEQTIKDLKDSLKKYYDKGKTAEGKVQMSHVETAYFWPAIDEAYVRAPNLAKRNTWQEGLSEIELNLRHFRPRDD